MAFKRNTAMTRKILSVLMALCMLMGMFGCARVDIPETQQSETDSTTSDSSVTTAATTVTEPPQTTATSQTEPPPPDIRTVHLVCAGDNLIHSSIYKQAKRRAEANGEDGYDFDYVYEKVEKYLDGADIAILNQETIVTDELEPSDYPRFCSPADLGEKMIEMGFNAFSLSNNHILDRGEEGLLATLRFWDSHEGIIRYGAYRDEEDMNNIRTMEVNGVTFAFLGYMEHTNGLSLPSDSECKITYFDELDLIEQQVRRADEIADVVIVSAHYGKETINEQTQTQLDLTQKLVEWGADLIIGTQPHTAQGMEYIQKPDGSNAFVFYCLGNFVSAQSYELTMVGILGDLDIVKNMDTGEVTIENVKAIPIITQYGYNYSNIHIEPYATYTEEMLEDHGCDGFDQDTIDYVLSFIPEEFLAIE